MPKPRKIPWDADPHTKVKHALYERYLSKWSPIMLQSFKGDITIAEGFAGPGVYTDGWAGSPIIALRSVLDVKKLREQVMRRGMRFVFLDREQRCIDILRAELAKVTSPVALDGMKDYGFEMVVERGDCEPDLEQHLSRLEAWGRPMLVFLDTFGGSVSAGLLARIALNGHSEAIITLLPQYFTRFAEVDDITHGDKVFGSKEWRRVADEAAADKERWLLRLYRHTVRDAGFRYVLDFELINAKGEALYLVFGTTEVRGLQKMKEAMWEVDDVRGVGYRDPRDPDHETLDIQLEPHTAPLERLILAHLETVSDRSSTIVDLRSFALFQTVYKESHVPPVVRALLASGRLVNAAGGAGLRSFQDRVRLPM